MTTPGHPHDTLFRALLDSPARAAALIRDHLPPDIARVVAPTPPRPVDGTFIDEDLQGTRTDRLFAVDLTDGRHAFLYVLLEHKSAPDPRTPLQLLGYMVAIWKRHLEEDKGSPVRLPPILPVVFYHGAREWKVPLSVTGCIDAGDALRPWIDGLPYVLRDLGPIPYRDLSRERAVRAVLGALKFAFRKGVARDVLVPLLRDLPAGEALEVQVLRYIIRVYDTGLDEIRKSVELAKPEWGEGVMPTAAQELLEIGRAEGILIGKAEGKVEGKAEGQAEMLLKMMHRRFGDLPAEAEDRVRGAGIDQLDAWSDRFLDAERLEDVFDNGREH